MAFVIIARQLQVARETGVGLFASPRDIAVRGAEAIEVAVIAVFRSILPLGAGIGREKSRLDSGRDTFNNIIEPGLYLFKADVDLGEGLDGGINAERLNHAGLTLAEETECGDDTLQIWR